MQLILYAHFRKTGSRCRFETAARRRQMYEKIRPIYIGRVKIRSSAHLLIDMRAELYAFARQGVRIASGDTSVSKSAWTS